MFVMDYFGILGLNNVERYPKITLELVESKYREAVSQIDRKIKEITFDYARTEDNKRKTKEKFLSENEQIREAYNYCKKEGSITLRNKILETLKDANSHSVSSIREKKFNKGNIAISVSINQGEMEAPEDIDNDLKIIQINNVEYISKMPDSNIERKYDSNAGYLDKTLKNYLVILQDNEKNGHSYNCFAGKLDLEKMKKDPNYKKIFLQALEQNQMDTKRQKYLGFIYQESDGKYAIVKDDGQEMATEKAEELINKKESMREEDWQR